MNKDKQIKDLKERNDKLANQYRQLDIRYTVLEKRFNDLKRKYNKLNDRINRGIKYVDDGTYLNLDICEEVFKDGYNSIELCNILEGRCKKIDDKNE